MTVEANDVGTALFDLATLAEGAGRGDLAAEARSLRHDAPHSLVLVAAEGADATRLAAWIARTVPDLEIRTVETPVPSDGLGKVAIALRADRLVDAAAQDLYALLADLAPPAEMAVVVTGAGALGEGGLERVGRGLARVLRPDANVEVTELPASRVFLFEDGAVLSESAREPLERALAAFVAWLREPSLPDEGHRAQLGLRILDSLAASEKVERPSHASGPDLSAERLRGLAARVVRQFESEFETAASSVDSSLAGLERDVEAVLRHGERGSDDRTTPVDVRADLWEARAREAIETMLDRTREYAAGLLADVPWDEIEKRAQAAGVPGGFRARLVQAWRETDELPLPHVGDSVRHGLGDVPATPQAPALVQAGVGLFGGAIAYVLLGPVVGISLAVAGMAGSVVGARGSRQAATNLTPVFAEARRRFSENMDAYLDGIRVRTTAILDEAAAVVERPLPDPAATFDDALTTLRDRLARAAVAS